MAKKLKSFSVLTGNFASLVYTNEKLNKKKPPLVWLCDKRKLCLTLTQNSNIKTCIFLLKSHMIQVPIVFPNQEKILC